MPAIILEIHGERFAILPETEYLRLRDGTDGAPLPAGILDEEDLVDADAFVARSIGQDLKQARVAAGLTQGQLARMLHKSQSLVSAAERGTLDVGVRYVEGVLRACASIKGTAAPSPAGASS